MTDGVTGRMARSTFTFSSRTASALNVTGGSIADQREQLQQVVLEHVPHHARLLVVPAPMLDAHALRGRDLHVVHVLPVPDRLEDRVGEPEHQKILDGLLAQVVIDAVHLVLGEGAADARVQRAARSPDSRPNGFSMMIRTQGRCFGSVTRGAMPDSASRLMVSV